MVDQMEHSPTIRGRGRPGKVIGQTIKERLVFIWSIIRNES